MNNNQIRVKFFFPKWSTENLMRRICNTWNLKNFTYQHIVFVNDNTYSHAIIINYYPHQINPKIKKIPKKNILGLAWEPYIFLKKTKKIKRFIHQRVGTYLIGSAHCAGSYVPHYSFLLHQPMEPKHKKTKFMSLILSKKKKTKGHKYRHQLVLAILKTNLNIHIYGRGSREYRDKRVKGKFNGSSENPYKHYNFTIAIENSKYPHYISEKFTNAICLNCIPVYLGCPNIKTYFGENCHIKLTGKISKDIKLLKNIFNNQDKYLLNLDTARNHIENGNASLPVFLAKHWPV